MIRKNLLVLIIGLFLVLISSQRVLAQVCDPDDPSSVCYRPPQSIFQPPQPAAKTDPFESIFGKVQPPDALRGLVSKDPTGAFGINQFLSNLIALFYSVAAIVLIFMLLWGAFEWMTSGGDKEKIESARRRIISAIIGIILFAIAFAVIQILGQFTGFKFFVGQGFRGFTPGGGP